jgi:hypothetical protein
VPNALDPPHFRVGCNRERLRGRAYGPDDTYGAGQGAHGGWQYKVTVHLSETGGVETAVTNIQFQALFASNILATETVVPVLSVRANSSSDEALVFSADTHVGDVSAVTVKMTVQFRDANGNIGSVSNSFTCFGCWDY